MTQTNITSGHHDRTDLEIKELSEISQITLLRDLFVALDMVTRCEICPVFEGDTTFCVFAHFDDIFLHVLEGSHRACCGKLVWSNLTSYLC